MKEIRDIIRAFDSAQLDGRQTALATVVHVEGSSYRRPGARMLITDQGELTGAISGGCLEGDALRKALLVMQEKKSKLVTYDTMDEDDAKFGVGLGCNGIIQVLIEPIDPEDPRNPIGFLKAIAEKRQRAVLVTLFSLQDRNGSQTGTCLLALADNRSLGSVEHDALQLQLSADMAISLNGTHSIFRNYVTTTTTITAFVELIKPSIALVIVGAGNDAIPVVQMASILGWDTTLIDGRSNYARPERFPLANRMILAKPGNALDSILIDEQTVFILMTHNYIYDKVVLTQLLQRNVVYAGMLGPRKKLERVLNEWKEEGMIFNADQLAAIHSPVGLNIGAETSEEIALSMLSEIQAFFAGKIGLSLKVNNDVIHARELTNIQEKKIN